MTTNFTVIAHCGDKKEVQVTVLEEGKIVENAVLEDNEEREFCVYDSRIIAVREVEK